MILIITILGLYSVSQIFKSHGFFKVFRGFFCAHNGGFGGFGYGTPSNSKGVGGLFPGHILIMDAKWFGLRLF